MKNLKFYIIILFLIFTIGCIDLTPHECIFSGVRISMPEKNIVYDDTDNNIAKENVTHAEISIHIIFMEHQNEFLFEFNYSRAMDNNTLFLFQLRKDGNTNRPYKPEMGKWYAYNISLNIESTDPILRKKNYNVSGEIKITDEGRKIDMKLTTNSEGVNLNFLSNRDVEMIFIKNNFKFNILFWTQLLCE